MLSIDTLQMGELNAKNVAGVDTHPAPADRRVPALPVQLPGDDSAVPVAELRGSTFSAQTVRARPAVDHVAGGLALEAGVPAGIINVIARRRDVVGAVRKDIKTLSFVGSTAVGTHVHDLAGKHGNACNHDDGRQRTHAVVLPDPGTNALVGAGFGLPGASAWPRLWWCWCGAAETRLPDLKALAKAQSAGSEARHRVGR